MNGRHTKDMRSQRIGISLDINGMEPTSTEELTTTGAQRSRRKTQQAYHAIMLLLYAFQDLWKEWGDSNFQIFSQNCKFHHRRLESLEHFNVLFIYHSQHYRLILEDAILFLQGLLFHFCVHFLFFCKYTLHVCHVFNVI